MKKDYNNKITDISLSAKQIKSKLEDSLAYDHSKYKDSKILFDTKPSTYYKLPFSDYKIAVSEEIANQQLLLENLNKYINNAQQIEEVVEDEVLEEVEEKIETEENEINIIEEVCEFDEIEDNEIDEEEDDEEDDFDDFAELPFDNKAKKPSMTKIKVVDVLAVIEQIKRRAIEENRGKPIIGRRQINKMLKPYMLKRNNATEIKGMEDTLTSIDIYLNAVNKIEKNSVKPINDNSNDSLELNLNQIINDLEK